MRYLKYSGTQPLGLPETGGAENAAPSQTGQMNMNPVSVQSGFEGVDTDPLRAITGVVWGAIAGGALWMLLLAIVLLV